MVLIRPRDFASVLLLLSLLFSSAVELTSASPRGLKRGRVRVNRETGAVAGITVVVSDELSKQKCPSILRNIKVSPVYWRDEICCSCSCCCFGYKVQFYILKV